MLTATACSPGENGDSPGDDAAPETAPTQSVDEVAEPGRHTLHSATVDGLDRTWSVYSPESDVADIGPMPIMLVIHGTGDTGSGIRSGIGADLERHAEADGFIIAYVDGYENNWNECRTEGDWAAKEMELDDVELMREVVEGIHTDLGSDAVDTERVFALGFSSGGHMALRLAMEAPDLVAGVAPVAANLPAPENQSCDDSGEPMPVIFVQGREDAINPFEGGDVRVGSGPFGESRGEVLSAAESADWFAERNNAGQADGEPVTERDGDAEVTTWSGENPVRLVAVDDSGHSFPTESGRWVNHGGARYDGPGAIWQFLAESTGD